jgi:hypothetical protein
VRAALPEWQRIKTPPFVLEWIRHGYQIPFHTTPPRFSLANREMSAEQGRFVDAEVARLLQEGVVRPIPAEDATCTSPLGCVAKKAGSSSPFRLILDLSHLNTFINTPHIRLPAVEEVAHLLRTRDLGFTLDLKDGFYHLAIHPRHQRFLAFSWRNQHYAYCTLPFGLSVSPAAFHYLLQPVLAALRSHLRVSLYVDDLVCLCRSPQEARRARQRIRTLLGRLGLHTNLRKSVFVESTTFLYLGFCWTSTPAPTIKVPGEKLRSLRRLISHTLLLADQNAGRLRARTLARLLGSLNFVTRAVLPVRLMLRNAYRLLHSVPSFNHFLTMTARTRADLLWLRASIGQWNGRAACPIKTELTLSTDASDTGWGAALSTGPEAAGEWDRPWASTSINTRELGAVLFAVQTFAPQLRGKSILLRTDNTTTLSVVNSMGSRLPHLDKLARHLFFHLWRLKASIRAEYIHTSLNTTADRLSRTSNEAWSLGRAAFGVLDSKFGPFTIDRYASHLNTQLPLFNSAFPQPGSLGSPALAQPDWGQHNNYCNPPWSQLLPLTKHLRRTGATATVIAPLWPSAPWFPLLRRMLWAPPLLLTPSTRVFRPPPGGTTPEPLRNRAWRVLAWPVCGARA